MDGPGDFTKWSKSERESQIHIESLLCGIFFFNDINEFTYKTETDLEDKFMVTKGKMLRNG